MARPAPTRARARHWSNRSATSSACPPPRAERRSRLERWRSCESFAVPRYLDFTPRERSIDARERLIDHRVPAVAAANGWKSSSFARLWSFFERSLRHESALGRWKFALVRGSHLQRASTVAPRPSRSRETRKGSPRRGTRRLFTTQDFDRVPTRSLKPDRATARSLFTIVRSREAAIVDRGSMFC